MVDLDSNDDWPIPIVLPEGLTVLPDPLAQPEFQDPPIYPPEPTAANLIGAFANSFIDWYDGLPDQEIALLHARYAEAGEDFGAIVTDARRHTMDAYVNEDYPDEEDAPVVLPVPKAPPVPAAPKNIARPKFGPEPPPRPVFGPPVPPHFQRPQPPQPKRLSRVPPLPPLFGPEPPPESRQDRLRLSQIDYHNLAPVPTHQVGGRKANPSSRMAEGENGSISI